MPWGHQHRRPGSAASPWLHRPGCNALAASAASSLAAAHVHAYEGWGHSQAVGSSAPSIFIAAFTLQAVNVPESLVQALLALETG